MTAIPRALSSLCSRAGRALYGIYAWLALLGIVFVLLPAFVVARDSKVARRLARHGAKLFFLAIGSPVELAEPDARLPQACVVVANHSSYLDGVILTAALPPKFTFVIKHEMSRVPIASFVLQRLGSEFVRRDEARHRNRTARRLYLAARQGAALAFFPEGTFDELPGLKPFHLGAFAAAFHAELPVVPIVITGARRKLGDKTWLPAPGPLSVRVCAPLEPGAHTSALELMQASRSSILAHLDEPDRLGLEAHAVSTESPARPVADPERS